MQPVENAPFDVFDDQRRTGTIGMGGTKVA
jgi:hypothetical protein